MTRRHLPPLAGAILFFGVAAGAPTTGAHLRAAGVESVAARRSHTVHGPTTGATSPVDVYLGDGVFRVRIRACDSCPASVTIEVTPGQLWRLITSPLTN
jgi:hypothetical protein